MFDNKVTKFLLYIDNLLNKKNGASYVASPFRAVKLLGTAEKLANFGTWHLDINKNELYWSTQVYEIFELDPKSFPATYEGFLSAIHPDDREMVNKAYTHSLETKLPYEVTHRLLVGDNITKYVTERCETYFDKAGKPTHSVGTIHDITHVIELERELGQSRKMDSLGKLAGGVAHDYNNLLGVIVGYADMIISKIAKDSEIYDEIFEIQKAAGKSVAITKQLLTFSRNNYEKQELLNLNDSIISLCSILNQLLHENVSIRYEIDPAPRRILISKPEVDQILINLVSNAKDSMLSGGYVTVSTRSDGNGNSILEVRDTGEGIKESDLPHIFEPFFTTKTLGTGTGLGLSTVYGIVKKYNGTVSITSQMGVGTSVQIKFKDCSQCDMFPECDPCHSDTNYPFQEKMYSVKVLLVEDDLGMNNLVKSMITSMGGMVEEFSSPVNALERFAADPHSFDVVITDVVMPGIDGDTLRRKIQLLRPDLPIILISGYTSATISDLVIKGDEVNFLSKPFTMNDLKIKLMEVCGI